MVYVTWKLERYARQSADGGWEASPTEITEFYDPLVRVNTGDARDEFSFKVSNTNNEFDNYFQAQDKIVISRKLNSTSLASSDILMVGVVKAVPVEEDGSKDLVRVEGYNFSESILSGFAFTDPTNVEINQAIVDVVNSIKAQNTNFGATAALDSAGGHVAATTTSGGSFPVVGERWYNKSAKEFLERFSTNASTEDGRYYWYINKDNELVWQPMLDTATDSYDSSTGTQD